MKLLLDTCALLWATGNEARLSDQARAEIGSDENVVYVSLVSLWELRIKESIGKITLPKNFYKKIEPVGFEILPLSLHHIEAVGGLPLHHRDPFDRMLVAQAKVEQLTLVTNDQEMIRYDVSFLRA